MGYMDNYGKVPLEIESIVGLEMPKVPRTMGKVGHRQGKLPFLMGWLA